MRETLFPSDEGGLNWRQDLRSKLTDGLLAVVILALLLSMMVLLIQPIRVLAGRPGLFIYTISLMAISAYSLERSLITRYPDTTRAWYGLAGGLVGWISISLGNDLSSQGLTSITSVLLLILITLIISPLWRRHLPQGMRFYSISLLLAWTGQILILGEPEMLLRYPLSVFFFKGLACLFVLIFLLVVGWMFTQTDKRIQRLATAPWLAFLIIVSAFLLR